MKFTGPLLLKVKSRLWVIAFILVQICPMLVLSSYREQIAILTNFGQLWQPAILLCAAPFLITVEFCFWVLAFGAAKVTGGKIGRATYLILILSCSGFYAATIGSWYAYYVSGSFLRRENAAVLLFLSDFSNIKTIINSPTEAMIFCGGLAVAFVFAYLFARNSPALKVRGLRAVAGHLIANAAIATAFMLSAKIESDESVQHRLSQMMRYQLSPTMSLLTPSARPAIAQIDLGGLVPVKPELTKTVGNQKNVILIMVEALRHDCIFAGPQGVELTPNLNQLARDGVFFRDSFANAPETDYSQLAILLGQHPLRSVSRDLHFDNTFPHALIYDLLSNFGYSTAYFTNEWEVTRRVSKSSLLGVHFDPRIGLSEKAAAKLNVDASALGKLSALSTAAQDRIKLDLFRRWIKINGDSPFFASFFLYATHFPYDLPADAKEIYTPTKISAPPSFFGYDEQDVPAMRNRYWNTVHYVDTLIGEIISEIKAQGVLDNTILIITADHGEEFLEYGGVTHGKHLNDSVLRVPLIIWDNGNRFDLDTNVQIAEHIDIAPTILDLLGLPRYDGHQGQSLLNSSKRDQPSYATVQTVFNEDSATIGPRRVVVDRASSVIRHDELKKELNNQTPPYSWESLERALNDFRTKQIGYYQLKEEERAKYYPPGIVKLFDPK